LSTAGSIATGRLHSEPQGPDRLASGIPIPPAPGKSLDVLALELGIAALV